MVNIKWMIKNMVLGSMEFREKGRDKFGRVVENSRLSGFYLLWCFDGLSSFGSISDSSVVFLKNF